MIRFHIDRKGMRLPVDLFHHAKLLANFHIQFTVIRDYLFRQLTLIGEPDEEQRCSDLLLLYFNKSTQNEDLQLSCLENIQSTDWWNSTFCQPTG